MTRRRQTAYPDGFWWPNELVRGKYINAPSVYDAGPGRQHDRQEVQQQQRVPLPRRHLRRGQRRGRARRQRIPDPFGNNALQHRPTTRTGRADGLGIPSWYMLDSRNETNTNASHADRASPVVRPPRRRQAPFMGFQSGATTRQDQVPRLHATHAARSKKAAGTVDGRRSADNNWYDQTPAGCWTCRFQRLPAAAWAPVTGRRRPTAQRVDEHRVLRRARRAVSVGEVSEPASDIADTQVQEVIFYINKRGHSRRCPVGSSGAARTILSSETQRRNDPAGPRPAGSVRQMVR